MDQWMWATGMDPMDWTSALGPADFGSNGFSPSGFGPMDVGPNGFGPNGSMDLGQWILANGSGRVILGPVKPNGFASTECENDVEKKMGPVDWGQEALDRWILAPGQGGQGTRPAPGGTVLVRQARCAHGKDKQDPPGLTARGA